MFTRRMTVVCAAAAAAVVLSGYGAARADSERKIEFENSTGKDVNDLHIELKQSSKVKKKKPFTSVTGSNTSTIDFKDGTVKKGKSAVITLTNTSNAVEIKKWWWTIDGEREGDVKGDNGDAVLSFNGGPAAGDGAVLVSIDGQENVFQTRRGAPPDVSTQMFVQFLHEYVDDLGDPLIHVVPGAPNRLYFSGNVMGDIEVELAAQVLRPDSGQPIELIDPENVGGACCLPQGECAEMPTDLCQDSGGSFQGSGVSCEFANCQSGNCTGQERLVVSCQRSIMPVKWSKARPFTPATVVVDGEPRQQKTTNRKGVAKFKITPVEPGPHLVEILECPVRQEVFCP